MHQSPAADRCRKRVHEISIGERLEPLSDSPLIAKRLPGKRKTCLPDVGGRRRRHLQKPEQRKVPFTEDDRIGHADLGTVPFATVITKHSVKERSAYADVDSLQAATTLDAAAAKCGVSLDVKGSGPEVRLDCPFGCSGDHCGRREVAINTDNPQKVFQCHAYDCGFRGNLLTLMHGWLTGNKPAGGKLKGDEFQRVKKVLAAGASTTAQSSVPPATPPPAPPERNVPLANSDDERIRELTSIDEKFIRDVGQMNPAAAAYVRRHPCLSSESMTKWRVGYLPQDGGGDKRGWSLRGSLIYPVFSEAGEVLSWVGRDVHYEEKEREFGRLSPAEREGKEPPGKHRFPKGFHRGLELYGQQASRLAEPGYRQFIAEHGLVVVEGFNDVIGLDNIGVPALGIMSNRMTEAQGLKITRWAKQLASGRVILLFDCEPTGSEGAKEALWFFAQQQLDVRLAWSPSMHGASFSGKQPESLTRADLTSLWR